MSDPVGTGSQTTTSKNWQKNYPGFAEGNLMDFNSLLGQVLGRGDILDTSGTSQAKGVLSNIAGGANLSPESDPWFNQVVQSLTSTSNQAFDRDLNKLAGTVNKAGWSTSGKELAAGGDLASRYANTLGTNVGNLAGDIYERGLGRQLTAASDLPNFDNAALNRALQLGQFLQRLGGTSGGTSTTSSSSPMFQVIMDNLDSLLGSLGGGGGIGGAGGLAALA